ncbi:MAG TPA: DUF5916 domain-containing protein [bacterium]|nr:DUF5916 domain-containing protein [bacterium]
MKTTVRFVFLFALLCAVTGVSARQVTAVRTQVPPLIDGRLTDIGWTQAEATTGFVYRGIGLPWPASQQTLVRVLYDSDALYIGVACYETEVDEIVADMVYHDDPLWLDDSFAIFLDTFDDGRSAYMLVVNPLGTRYDAYFTQDGQYIDSAWDGDWKAAAGIEEDRWVAEFKIPWRELHYVDPTDGWGIDFWRNEIPNDESSIWSNLDTNLYKVSKFGRLEGIRDLGIPVTVSFVPYGTAKRQWNDVEDAILWEDPTLIETGVEDTFSGGIDIDFRPFPAMSIVGSINPDYAQIESDLDELNLSRDELYLNEKRPFFRDGKSLFDLPLELFYSRRLQDIYYAGKLYGKLGGLRYYLLDVEGTVADKADLSYYRGDWWRERFNANVAAVRLTHDIFESSAVGLTAINKYQRERMTIESHGPFDWEYVTAAEPLNDTTLGLDFSWATDFGLQATGEFAYETNPERDVDDYAWYVGAEWNDPNWTIGIQGQQVQPNFDAEMGYLPYTDLDTLGGYAYVEYLWGIWEGWFKDVYVGGDYYHYDQNTDELLAYQGWSGYVGVDFLWGLTLYGSYWNNYDTEEITETERFSYQNGTYSGTLGFNLDRYSGLGLTYVGGDFYGYDLNYWELEYSYALFSGLTFEGGVEFEKLADKDILGAPGMDDLGWEGQHWFVNLGMTAKFVDEVWLRVFGQRNTFGGREELNALLAYNYLPGSYVYLVYNLLQPTTREEAEHILFLKLTFALDI